MKSLYLATTAVALLIVTPAMAQDRVGSVGVAYNNPSMEVLDSETDADVVTVDGVVALPVADWTVTLEGVADRGETDAGDNLVGGGAVHLTRLWRPDIRIGGFVGGEGFGDGVEGWSGGFEVQKYFAGATVTGRASHSSFDFNTDFWTLEGEAAFYVGRALRLHAAASYSDVEVTEGISEAWAYGVGAEYQLAGTPFSVTGDFSRTDMDLISVDTLSIGLRYSFGGDLQARDRAGGGLRSGSVMRTLNFFSTDPEEVDEGDDGGDDDNGPL